MSPVARAARSPSPRGGPRSLRAKRAILDAVHELVEKGVYDAATMEATAERAGVAKTTIYRWWPNRPALVVDVLFEMGAPWRRRRREGIRSERCARSSAWSARRWMRSPADY